MAAITPTVQKVTNGLRGIVKSLIENRKTKARHADTAADESLEANASPEAASQTESPSTARKTQNRSSSRPKVSAKSKKQSNKKPTEAVHKNSAGKSNSKKAESSAAPMAYAIPGVDQDPAHKPGHQKMNLRAEFSEKTGKKGKSQNSKAMNYMSGSDKVHRTTSPHRRIINGAGTLGAKAPQGRSRKAH